MTNSNTTKTKPTVNNLLLTVAKFLLIAVIVYFVYRQFAKSWEDLISYSWSISFPLLAASIIMHILTFVLLSKVWCFLIGSFGHKVPLLYAFKISYIANLGRYIPGKIWPVIGMSYLAKKLDINEEVSVTSWVIAMIFSLPSSFLAGFTCFLISPELKSLELSTFANDSLYIIIFIIFVVSLLIIVIPNRTFALLNYLLRKLKRQEIKFKISLKTSLTIYFGYFACWLCYGFAFWLLVTSISGTSDIPVIASIGAFIIAYQVGYLAFFAPGGIGARELVLIAVLSPFIGPIAAGIAVAARIWNLTVEIMSALIAWAIKLPENNKIK